MDDIEDLVNDISLRDLAGNSRVQTVKLHPKSGACPPTAPGEARTDVPGNAKIWTKTFGCSHNVSDGEYMEGALTSYGYEFTENKDDADLWLINSCTVKDPSQSAFVNLVQVGKGNGKSVVVSGCVPQGDRNLGPLEEVSVVGVTQIDQIVNVVEQTLQGNTVRLLAKKALPSLDIPKVRKNKLVEIVPLSTGCLGSCTYCKTKHARGKLGSYDLEALVSRVEQVLEDEKEVREFWLASEDTGAYGRDIGTDLPTLLFRLTRSIELKGGKERMLRLGMTNPPFILGHLDRIAEAMRHQNMFKFLHVPVQSGSNKVLEEMNREYTVEEFRLVADYMRKHVPGITLATDIICGFPGETEEEFEETMDLVKRYQFPVLNISQFYPRPGTPAAKMQRIDTQIVKERSRKLSTYFETYFPHTHLEGKTVECWISEEISKRKDQSIGHTRSYVKVTIKPRVDDRIGEKVYVKITKSHKFHVEGEIVQAE